MRIIAIILLASLGFTSCTPVLSPFTSKVKREANLGGEELKQVQFYISHDIVLRRELSGSKTEITSGELKILNGVEIQEIVIEAGTPGVVIAMPSADNIGVSFESGTESYLLFGRNKARGGAYTLLAKNWENRRGRVDYDGNVFYTDEESAMAELLVNLKKLDSFSKESRVAGGRTIGN